MISLCGVCIGRYVAPGVKVSDSLLVRIWHQIGVDILVFLVCEVSLRHLATIA